MHLLANPTFYYPIIFLIPLVITLVITPLIIRWAVAHNLIDTPAASKIHLHPIPYAGGIAVFLGFLVAILFGVMVIPGLDGVNTFKGNLKIVGLLSGSSGILILGLLDDWLELSPLKKLSGQLAIVLLVCFLGYRMDLLTNPLGGTLYLGPIGGTFFTTLWFLAIINAMNLIDGIDGLASGIALIAGLTLFTIYGIQGDLFGSIVSLALSGTLLGFLRYNFHPATIFLGDSGSMLLGFILAAVSVHHFQKAATLVTLLIPIAALGLPILDTTMAIIRRSSFSIRKVFSKDKHHIHHRILALNIPIKDAVIFLYMISMLLGLCAFLMNFIAKEYSLILLTVLLLIFLSNIKLLHFLEITFKERLKDIKRFSLLEKTGVMDNLFYFKKRVQEALAHPNGHFLVFSIKLIGLNQFTTDGDTSDHIDYLREVIESLKNCIRRTDTIVYLGQENFAILIKNIENSGKPVIQRIEEELPKHNFGTMAVKIDHVYTSSNPISVARYLDQL